MQYGNLSPSAYSQLKIHIITVETENKEKIEELNQKIGNTSSKFNTQLNNQIATIEKILNKLKLVYLSI
jgi:pentose-5-phosphate-3-epimerase